MKRSAIHLGLIGAFVFALALAAAPQLHEQLHADAGQPQHQCAVTLLASGSCHSVSAPPIPQATAPLLPPVGVVPLEDTFFSPFFLEARILEHAPPQAS